MLPLGAVNGVDGMAAIAGVELAHGSVREGPELLIDLMYEGMADGEPRQGADDEGRRSDCPRVKT